MTTRSTLGVFRIKCCVCEREGKTSKLRTAQGSSNHQAGIDQYWDHEGVYHCHDPNSYFQKAYCSNRHAVTITTTHPCPAPGCSEKGGVEVKEKEEEE
jgi:hypothetical protein